MTSTRSSDASLTAFFAAADRLFACKPWDTAHDSHVMRLDATPFGWPAEACLIFVGDKDDRPGLMLFRSLQEYLRFIEKMEQVERTGRPPMMDLPVMSINFDGKREAPKEAAKRAKALGLRPADPQGFPWIERFDASGRPRDADDDDYALAAALLDAAAHLLEQHPDVFLERGDLKPGAHAAKGVFLIEGAPERAVELTLPHPDMPWEWGESALEYYRWWEADDVAEAFLKSIAEAGGSEEEQQACAEAAARWFRFKIETQQVEPLDVSDGDVAEFLLEHCPAEELFASEDAARALPDKLELLLRWLGETERVDADLAGDEANEIAPHREEYLDTVNEPARFGPEKAAVLAMQAAGVDPKDEAAVRRFMDDAVARAALLPDDVEAPPAPEKKWVWQPGEPAPDPKGACPCGSGRRYKKCCMPR